MLMDIDLSDGGPELSNHDIMRMYVMVEAVRDMMARVLRAKKMDAAAILDEVRRKESAAATLGYRHEIDDAGNSLGRRRGDNQARFALRALRCAAGR